MNIDYDKDGEADINIDTNGDKKADVNKTDTDSNNNGNPDLNVDTNKDGYPDINIDLDGDGKPDINIDTDGNNVADLNIDYNKDGKADINVDTNKDGQADKNLTDSDTDGNNKADINIDLDDDGYPDINIDINGDGYPDVNIDSSIHFAGSDSVVVDALGTMMMPENISLEVSAEDLANSKIGNQEYNAINSEEKKATISLKSNADTTSCKYNIKYVPEYNYFENKYTASNGTLGTLKNQLVLNLDGYTYNNGIQEKKTSKYDLVEITSEKVLLENMVITDIEDDVTTNIEWKISISFNNYKNYNQNNNAGKKARGNISIQMLECERTK